jgi:hypothetical protein
LARIATSLSPEERSARSRIAARSRSAGPDHPSTNAARRVFEQARDEGRKKAAEWLAEQIEQGRLRPLDEQQLVKVASIIRVAQKAIS